MNRVGAGSLLEIEDTIELSSYAQLQMELKNSTVLKITKLDTKALMLPVILTSEPLMLGLDILILLFAQISRASHLKEKSKELSKQFTKLSVFK
jgi:GTPase